MAKRSEHPPSININEAKIKVKETKSPNQTTNPNSKREKEILGLIKNIDFNRITIYKKAYRYLNSALIKTKSSNDIYGALSGYLESLKDYNFQESQLKVELQAISIPPENATTTTTTTYSDSSNSDNNNNQNNNNNYSNYFYNQINYNNNNNYNSTPISVNGREQEIMGINNISPPSTESNDLTPPSSQSSSSSTSSPSKRVSRSKTRAPKKAANQTISLENISSGATENVTTTTTTSTMATETTDATSIATSEPTKKKKGRPCKIIPVDGCYICRRIITPYWRKGTCDDQRVDLCNACGLQNFKKGKKEQLSKKQNSINNILN
ncbi:hypothetical protein ACTFIW_002769 [Dictyostelium discoideum]